MLTRRTFLVGAAGSITTALVQKFEWFIRENGVALIEAPRIATTELYVGFGFEELEITLGPPEEDPGIVSWAEFFQHKSGSEPLTRIELLDACYDWGLDEGDLGNNCDWETWFCFWGRNQSPRAKAYRLLDSLDLGPELTGARGEVGGLDFLDGPSIASNNLGVQAADALSVSLLQYRLTELGTGIELVLP
jgi:hypothetical protein